MTRVPDKQQPGLQPHKLTVSDREFLPAALEILLTPPSPISQFMLLSICGLFFCALAWSYFGWIDIYAIAPGRIQPAGHSKILQPLDAGKVVAVRVKNGDHVNAGDVLLELDSTEPAADLEAQSRDLEAARAEIARRRAAIEAASGGSPGELPQVGDLVGVPPSLQLREQSVLAADLTQLKSSLASLAAQLAEKQASRDRLDSTIVSRQKSIELAKERVSMREKLDERGAGARVQTIEALQQYEGLITTDTGDRGQLLEIEAAMVSLKRKGAEVVASFVAEQSQKLSDVERRRDHLEQDLIKAKSKANHAELKASISGVVQQLGVTTVGQVVTSGQPILTIVPLDPEIEVEALIADRDIGFVAVGQDAAVKIDAFPFTRYGVIDGTIVRVSREAVEERNATGLSDAASAVRPQGGSGSPPKSENLVFPATIRLAHSSIRVEGKDVALIPGMSVSAEIITGRRRVLDYVISPLREVVSGAGRER